MKKFSAGVLFFNVLPDYIFFIDECSHLNRGLVKRPGAVCARVMYNYFYCKKCIRKFNMAIKNLKIGCFDVKVSGCVGTGHHSYWI